MVIKVYLKYGMPLFFIKKEGFSPFLLTLVIVGAVDDITSITLASVFQPLVPNDGTRCKPDKRRYIAVAPGEHLCADGHESDRGTGYDHINYHKDSHDNEFSPVNIFHNSTSNTINAEVSRRRFLLSYFTNIIYIRYYVKYDTIISSHSSINKRRFYIYGIFYL